MRCMRTLLAGLAFGVLLWGCDFSFDLGSESLFPIGTTFVISGTADVVPSDNGACRIWVGDNGVIYHLFQTPRIENDDFDRITTSGVTSRLELATRTDLVVDCQMGTIVQVEDILEIVP